MGDSKNQEPYCRPPNSRALLTRTPQNDPQFLETALYKASRSEAKDRYRKLVRKHALHFKKRGALRPQT